MTQEHEVLYLRYRGKQPRKRDRLYGSGVVWNSHGDIRPVPLKPALKLLAHRDAFEQVSAKRFIEYAEQSGDSTAYLYEIGKARERAKQAGQTGDPEASGKQTEVEAEEIPKPPKAPSQMKKAECVAYAEQFGYELDDTQPAKALQEAVKELAKTGRLAGVDDDSGEEETDPGDPEASGKQTEAEAEE